MLITHCGLPAMCVLTSPSTKDRKPSDFEDFGLFRISVCREQMMGRVPIDIIYLRKRVALLYCGSQFLRDDPTRSTLVAEEAPRPVNKG